MLHRLTAEFIGTFWLVLGGCGSAVFAAKFASSDGASLGIGFLGVALAFGLTVLTGVYAFGTISGGHFNPAVTLGAAFARRVEWKAVPGYWVVQVIGGLVAGLVILVIANGKEGFDPVGNMAANGYGDHSPGGYSLLAVALTEVILTGVFLLVISGSTDDRATAAVDLLAGTPDRCRDRRSRLSLPVRRERGTLRPAGARRRPRGIRSYLTGAFFLARLAAAFSVLAPPLAS